MGDKRFSVIVPLDRGLGLSLGTWRCTRDHTGPGAEQAERGTLLNVTLGGVYQRHHGSRTFVADPGVATVTAPGEAWRASHPCPTCGDRGVWVWLDPTRAEAPVATAVRRLPARAWLDWAVVARTGDEGLALALVADVLAGPVDVPHHEPAFVREARMLLADPAAEGLDLPTLAARVGVSPWHLCRTFRAVTGTTPRAYGERARLSVAAERIAAGCPDLTGLALSLGFSSHSHLSARFRAVFGRVPSALRAATART